MRPINLGTNRLHNLKYNEFRECQNLFVFSIQLRDTNLSGIFCGSRFDFYKDEPVLVTRKGTQEAIYSVLVSRRRRSRSARGRR